MNSIEFENKVIRNGARVRRAFLVKIRGKLPAIQSLVREPNKNELKEKKTDFTVKWIEENSDNEKSDRSKDMGTYTQIKNGSLHAEKVLNYSMENFYSRCWKPTFSIAKIIR